MGSITFHLLILVAQQQVDDEDDNNNEDHTEEDDYNVMEVMPIDKQKDYSRSPGQHCNCSNHSRLRGAPPLSP